MSKHKGVAMTDANTFMSDEEYAKWQADQRWWADWFDNHPEESARYRARKKAAG